MEPVALLPTDKSGSNLLASKSILQCSEKKREFTEILFALFLWNYAPDADSDGVMV
jgi:hypothetical protein